MLVVKNLPPNAGDARNVGLIPVSGRSPGGGKWQPTPVFLAEKFHRQDLSRVRSMGLRRVGRH